MPSRRQTLKQSAAAGGLLVAGGLLPRGALAWNRAAFDARAVAEAVRAYGAATLTESKDVSLTGPEIAENGAVVPLAAATTLPGVKHLLLLVEKNPNVLVAQFDVSESVEPSFSTRAKMAQSSDVYAVAVTADGKAYFARKDIKVTLGGCGG